VHPEDHVYYVIECTLSVCLGGDRSDAPKGSCIVIPGGTPHDFANRSEAVAGFISFNTPGDFEPDMEAIRPALAAEDLRL
jgi:mannose-6-phosphate isomerase-like protein (cupin superfamily)